MHTFQIAESVLDEYKNNKLSEERINFLITQANEQLEEISQKIKYKKVHIAPDNSNQFTPALGNYIVMVIWIENVGLWHIAKEIFRFKNSTLFRAQNYIITY